MKVKRAAYFQSSADYFGRPLDDGILRALMAAGFAIDIFAPGSGPDDLYGGQVRRLPVTYGRSWLQKNLSFSWRSFHLFLGTADLPMAFAGIFAGLTARPSVTVCDEIYIGGYQGEARLYWKTLARHGMRRAKFTIITDRVREPLQREYAGLNAGHEFVEYPCCYPTPWQGRSRSDARRSLGLSEDEVVVSFTGAFSEPNGAAWVVRLLDRLPGIRVLVQTAGRPGPVVDSLLERLATEGRLIYLPERLAYLESMEITAAADVGLVLYLSDAPQARHMGVSSQKLCTYLRLGIPVVATEQPSFAFLEGFGCGVLVRGEEELADAVEAVAAKRKAMGALTTAAIEGWVRPEEKLEILTGRLRTLVR